MMTPRSTGEHRRLICFLALAVPYLVVGLADYLVLARHYFDNSASYSLHFWIATSLGWIYGTPGPLFIYGAPITHHPSIPETEIGGLILMLMGGNVRNLTLMAAIGILLNAAIMLGVAWWGARMAARHNLWWPALMASAALAAVQPGMMFTWLSYPHYIMVLVLAGLSLYVLGRAGGTDNRDGRAAFFILGFALTMQYPAVIPILALMLGIAAGLSRGDKPTVYRDLAARRVGLPFATVAIGLGAVFLVGIVSVQFGLAAKLAAMAREDVFAAVVVAAVAAAGTAAVCFAAVRFLPRTGIGRALINGGGRALIGWALGANLLILIGWAIGLNNIPSSSPMQIGLIESMLTQCLWLLVLPLLLGAGGAMFVQAQRSPEDSGRLRFLAGFVIALVLLNVWFVPGYPAAPTMEEFGIARYFASVVMAIPPVLLWMGERSRRLGGIGVAVALVLAMGTWTQYALLVRPAAVAAVAVEAPVERLIASYRKADPETLVLCGGFMSEACGVAFAHDYYELFHNSNDRNRPLPPDFRDPRVRNFQGDFDCASVDACLAPFPSGRSSRVLVVMRGPMPAALQAGGRKPTLPPGFPAGVTVRIFDASP